VTLTVLALGEDAPLHRLAEAVGAVILARLRLVEAAHEEQTGDLLDHLERVGDAARPEGIPDGIDLGPKVTFRKDVLQHLGVRPRKKIELHKLPGGKIALTAARPRGSIDRFIGLLAGRASKVSTIEEIDEAAAAGWVGRR